EHADRASEGLWTPGSEPLRSERQSWGYSGRDGRSGRDDIPASAHREGTRQQYGWARTVRAGPSGTGRAVREARPRAADAGEVPRGRDRAPAPPAHQFAPAGQDPRGAIAPGPRRAVTCHGPEPASRRGPANPTR